MSDAPALPDAPESPLAGYRRAVEGFTEQVGAAAVMAGQVVTRGLKRPFEFWPVVYQIEQIGVRSLSIGTLTALFAGMVLSVQFGYFLVKFGIGYAIGRVMALSVLRELGPVLTALTVGGRVGSGIAAELGSMQVTEQIDAIRALGADPIKKLVMPRVVAAMICMPILAAIADLVAMGAGAVMAKTSYGISYVEFYRQAVDAARLEDFLSGVFKAAVFGGLIALVGCYKGFTTQNGTEGVGLATTETVAISAIGVLVADLLLTTLLLSL